MNGIWIMIGTIIGGVFGFWLALWGVRNDRQRTCDADFHNFVATFTNVDKSQTHTMTCTYCGKSVSLVGVSK